MLAGRAAAVGVAVSAAARAYSPSTTTRCAPAPRCTRRRCFAGGATSREGVSRATDPPPFFRRLPGSIPRFALASPESHPKDQPEPGPAGRVPANWESLRNEWRRSFRARQAVEHFVYDVGVGLRFGPFLLPPARQYFSFRSFDASRARVRGHLTSGAMQWPMEQ